MNQCGLVLNFEEIIPKLEPSPQVSQKLKSGPGTVLWLKLDLEPASKPVFIHVQICFFFISFFFSKLFIYLFLWLDMLFSLRKIII